MPSLLLRISSLCILAISCLMAVFFVKSPLAPTFLHESPLFLVPTLLLYPLPLLDHFFLCLLCLKTLLSRPPLGLLFSFCFTACLVSSHSFSLTSRLLSPSSPPSPFSPPSTFCPPVFSLYWLFLSSPFASSRLFHSPFIFLSFLLVSSVSTSHLSLLPSSSCFSLECL